MHIYYGKIECGRKDYRAGGINVGMLEGRDIYSRMLSKVFYVTYDATKNHDVFGLRVGNLLWQTISSDGTFHFVLGAWQKACYAEDCSFLGIAGEHNVTAASTYDGKDTCDLMALDVLVPSLVWNGSISDHRENRLHVASIGSLIITFNYAKAKRCGYDLLFQQYAKHSIPLLEILNRRQLIAEVLQGKKGITLAGSGECIVVDLMEVPDITDAPEFSVDEDYHDEIGV